MQVFKVFFKVLKMHSRTFIMYTCIFLGITLLVSGQANTNDKKGYVSKSCKFAYFDYDNSKASKCLIKFLKENNKCVSIERDDKELIQDELFNRNIDCALRVKSGFEDSLESDNIEDYLEVYSISSTQTSTVLQSQINGFMKLFDTYVKSGYDIESGAKAAKKASKTDADVKMLTKNAANQHSKIYYFFLYCSYVFIVMAVVAVGSIILILNNKELQRRIQCSSYKLSSYYFEIFLGVAATGFLIWLLYFLIAFILNGSTMMTMRGLLFGVNMAIIMLVALSITFFVSQFIKSDRALDMIANIVGLGSSFLCGVFVPMQFLGDGVIKIAHFLPSYWYVLACEKIDYYSKSSQISGILYYFGMELVFVLIFISIGIAAALAKRNHSS